MDKWDWSAIFTGCAVAVSLIALWFQRKDLKKQAVYQRNTFELQNIIEENKIIFEISSNIISTVKNLALTKNEIYLQILEKKKRWQANVNGAFGKSMGNDVYAYMTEAQYNEALEKLKSLEQGNDSLMEELEQLISKQNINIVSLDKEKVTNIKNLTAKFLYEFKKMDEAIENISKIDDVDELLKKDQTHWARQHHIKIHDITDEFESIVIMVKKETQEKFKDIQKLD